MKIARFDVGEIRGTTEFTDEGYLKADAVVTRYGVFDYQNPDGTLRREYRPKEEVINDASLETMKMIPITNNHPEERLVNSENAKKLSVGYTGETISYDDCYVMARLIITDQETIDDIVKRGKKELSLGYTVDLIDEKGDFEGERYDFKQSNIKYNHLSIVNSARAGSQARLNLDAQDAVEISKLDEEARMAKRKMRIDQEEMMVEGEVADYIERLLGDLKNLEDEKIRVEEEIKMIADKLEKALAEKDAAKEDLDVMKEEKQQLENEKMDSAEINKMIRDRVKLLRNAEAFLDKDVMERIDSMNDIEIKRKIIRSKSPNANLDGKSDVYISARYDAIMDEACSTKVIANGYKSKNDSHEERISANDARNGMIHDMKNAYKKKAGGN